MDSENAIACVLAIEEGAEDDNEVKPVPVDDTSQSATSDGAAAAGVGADHDAVHIDIPDSKQHEDARHGGEAKTIDEVAGASPTASARDAMIAALLDMGIDLDVALASLHATDYESVQAAVEVIFGQRRIQRQRSAESVQQPATLACAICMETVPIGQIDTAPCGHNYCFGCLEAYFNTKIKDGRVRKITCPEHRCDRVIQLREIRGRVSAEMFEKFQQYSFNAQVSTNPNARWCQNLGCENAMVGKSSRRKLECDQCGHVQCFVCNMPYHGETHCEKQIDSAFKEYAQGRDMRPCPRCGQMIERSEGCNHLTCTRCEFQFCWLCGGKYTDAHYYPWNVFGCPGLQNVSGSDRFGDRRRWPCWKRFLWRVLIFFLILIAVAVGLPALILVGVLCCPCFTVAQIQRWRRRRRFNYM